MERMAKYQALCLTVIGLMSIEHPEACASVVTDSVDAKYNYELKFAAMPEPKPEVVHSRVERETDRHFLWIFPLAPRNLEWEFELVAAPSWIEVLKQGFLPDDWSQLEPRSGLPNWFLPTPEAFS